MSNETALLVKSSRLYIFVKNYPISQPIDYDAEN